MIMPPELGRLEPVDLRTCWENEASSFTPWLASENNLALLGEAIGMDLELVGQEQWVGPFRADILCKNTASADESQWVLIENQLERTDHSHLGQLLTYAAGLHACSMVWIACRFTEEHRAALDWLNEHTTQDINFFGLEIQLWRIGTSAMAPKFNVVCHPNDYSRSVTASRDKANQNVSFRYSYWDAFLAALAESPAPLKMRRPSEGNWIGFSVGRTGYSINLVINPSNGWIRVELYLSGPTARRRFPHLQAYQYAVEAITGPLEWEGLVGKRDCRVTTCKRDSNPTDEDAWSSQHLWLAQQAKLFHTAFAPLLRAVDLESVPEAEQLDTIEAEAPDDYHTHAGH